MELNSKFIVTVADNQYLEFVPVILKEIEESAKERGTGIAKRSAEYLEEKINELVMNGASFREAYREVGNSIENETYNYRNDDLKHTHKGSIGNLALEEITQNFEEIFRKFN